MAEEAEKKVHQMQFQTLPEVKPFFADNVFVSIIPKEYGKNKERDTTIQLVFTNQNFLVSNVTVTVEHAKAIAELLKIKIAEAETFRKTGKLPQQPIVAKTTKELSYIG